MSYMDIENLYKNQDILLFSECYALEKIHGTSAHVGWKGGIYFFSGGINRDSFVALFDKEALVTAFEELGYGTIIFYGEAYGGKCQGMSETYGTALKFVVFEVKVGDSWFCVPDAEELALKFGFEFVYYTKITTDLSSIDKELYGPSIQAVRNGIEEPRKKEGIVLRPLVEVTKNNGKRILAKHKHPDFSEVKTPRVLSEDKLMVLANARAIAEEWVTPMRLTHILDSFPNASIKQTGEIISAMIVDIRKESEGETVWDKDTSKYLGARTAHLFKQYLASILESVML